MLIYHKNPHVLADMRQAGTAGTVPAIFLIFMPLQLVKLTYCFNMLHL